MYSITVNDVECVRYSIRALNNAQLRAAYASSTGTAAPKVKFSELLRLAEAAGFKFAANPGTGIVLIKA